MVIALGGFLQGILGIGLLCHGLERGVIILRVCPGADLLGIIHLFHGFRVLGFDDAAVSFRNEIANEGIECYSYGDDGKCSTDHNFCSSIHYPP